MEAARSNLQAIQKILSHARANLPRFATVVGVVELPLADPAAGGA